MMRLFSITAAPLISVRLYKLTDKSVQTVYNHTDYARSYHENNSIHEEYPVGFIYYLSQSRRLPPLQVVSSSKFVSVGVQSPTEINAPRGCAVILIGICQLCWPESCAKSHGCSTWTYCNKKRCQVNLRDKNTDCWHLIKSISIN